MLERSFAAYLLVTFMACGGGHKPPAPPTPPPPPSPVCEPGATCGCWHQPPGQGWQQLPPCGPTTTCQPFPSSDAPGWVNAGPRPTALYATYKAAAEAVGDTCGQASADEAPQFATLRRVAAEVVARGRCAEQHSDSVTILADDGLYEEWHAVAFGSGCTIVGPNAYVSAWRWGGTPPPPPTTSCPPPLPPLVWTAETLPPGWDPAMAGSPRWEMLCGQHGAVIDCTPTVGPRACDYCESIGMGEMGGQPRCGCPVRPDGHPERVACEEYLVGGRPVVEARNGATCVQRSNPFQFEPSGGNCRLCNPAGTVCSGWW